MDSLWLKTKSHEDEANSWGYEVVKDSSLIWGRQKTNRGPRCVNPRNSGKESHNEVTVGLYNVLSGPCHFSCLLFYSNDLIHVSVVRPFSGGNICIGIYLNYPLYVSVIRPSSSGNIYIEINSNYPLYVSVVRPSSSGNIYIGIYSNYPLHVSVAEDGRTTETYSG
jgi:hypothetical protein